jgi:hypothetical protein
VNPRVRFEDEAEIEYRLAAEYYEERLEHLGIEFLDAVDDAIARISKSRTPARESRGFPVTFQFGVEP